MIGGWRCAIPGLVLVSLAFAVSLAVPYEVGSDVAHQLYSALQWRDGLTPTPNHIGLPDPADLSSSQLTWGVWWPFGGSLLLAAVVKMSPSLSLGLRAFAFLLSVSGLLGWASVANRLGFTARTQYAGLVVVAIPLLSVGGVVRAQTLDFVGFGVFPWLVALAIARGRGTSCPRKEVLDLGCRDLLTCVLAGLLPMLKYSFIGGSISLVAFVLIRRGSRGSTNRWRNVVGGGILLLGFLVPLLGLLLLNEELRGATSTSALNDLSGFYALNEDGVGLLKLALDWLIAPTLTLAGSEGLLGHISKFSDWFSPATSAALRTGFGLAGGLVIGLGFAQLRNRVSKESIVLALSISLIPWLVLGALMLRIRAPLFEDPLRFLFPWFGIAGLTTTAYLIDRSGSVFRQLCRASLFVLLIMLPSLFILADFVRNGVIDRRGLWRDSKSGLTVPILGQSSASEGWTSIRAAVAAERLLAVVALPGGDGSSVPALLVFEVPVLPLNHFSGPHVESDGQDCYQLRSDCRFELGGWLGVAVLGWTAGEFRMTEHQLQARFPQVGQWERRPADSRRSLWIGRRRVPIDEMVPLLSNPSDSTTASQSAQRLNDSVPSTRR